MQSADHVPLEPLPIVVLLSGGGTTLANLLVHKEQHALPIEIRGVISSRSKVRGVDIAKNAGLDVRVHRQADFASPAKFSEVVFQICREKNVRYVVMAGFLCYLPIPDDFHNRVINIHPSLIPSFCGQGYHGLHVHEAVIAYGTKVSGCTVHFVDNEYDHGPIIAQSCVAVENDDTPETLAQRVFEQECLLYPQVLRALASKPVQIIGRRVKLA